MGAIQSLLCPVRLWLGVALWLALIHPSWANNVVVLVSGQGSSYTELLDSLQTEIRKTPTLRTTVGTGGTASWDTSLSSITYGTTQLLIAVGSNATRAALESTDTRIPVLCILLPKSTYEAMLATAKVNSGQRRISAIYLDQPLSRQLDLVRQALPKSNRLGVVLGPESSRDAERLQILSEARGLTLTLERAQRDTALYPALQRTLADTDVLLALPDPYVINPETAQNVLLTSFRQRVPVIGFSAAYVRAGALAAVFSSPAQIGMEAGEIARQVSRGQLLGAAKYPRYFSVTINRQVSNSLNLSLEDETTLRERLQKLERNDF
jgi:putative ABC transport system substrate-binding protein